MGYVVATFGEAEKGEFAPRQLCYSLAELVDTYGNPPEDSQGLSFAIQALLYDRAILFFRVKEEGFSVQDYLEGLRYLKDQNVFSNVGAICLPGVGDQEVIQVSTQVCSKKNSILVTTEADLYDYLTHSQGDD